MLMKQIWMAAASSDGRFMERKLLREFDSVCYHGICHSMTALIVELMPPMHVDAGMIVVVVVVTTESWDMLGGLAGVDHVFL